MGSGVRVMLQQLPAAGFRVEGVALFGNHIIRQKAGLKGAPASERRRSFGLGPSGFTRGPVFCL